MWSGKSGKSQAGHIGRATKAPVWLEQGEWDVRGGTGR